MDFEALKDRLDNIEETIEEWEGHGLEGRVEDLTARLDNLEEIESAVDDLESRIS